MFLARLQPAAEFSGFVQHDRNFAADRAVGDSSLSYLRLASNF